MYTNYRFIWNVNYVHGYCTVSIDQLKGAESVSDCELQVDGAHEDGIHAATDLEDSTSNNTLMEHNTLANMDTELVFSSKDFRSISSKYEKKLVWVK